MPLLHSYVSPTETGFSFSSAWSAFFFLLTSDLNWIYALWICHLSLSGVGTVAESCSRQTMTPVAHEGHPNRCISSTSSWLQFLPQSFCCFLPIFLAGLPSCQLIVWAIQHPFNKLIFSRSITKREIVTKESGALIDRYLLGNMRTISCFQA